MRDYRVLTRLLLAGATVALLTACPPANDGRPSGQEGDGGSPATSRSPAAPGHRAPASEPDPWRATREQMVRDQIESRGIRSPRVLAALRQVPRHRFVPEHLQASAYSDSPLPIGHRQTISQPYIVAFMSEALQVKKGERILEIGTGSGYQAAVLAAMGARVYTIEIVEPLGKSAAKILRELGYDQVSTKIGDGYRGWPEEAPFDAVILTAAPDHVPQPLIDQLETGGRLILPLRAGWDEELVMLVKTPNGLERANLLGVRFVPMTGEAQRR